MSLCGSKLQTNSSFQLIKKQNTKKNPRNWKLSQSPDILLFAYPPRLSSYCLMSICLHEMSFFVHRTANASAAAPFSFERFSLLAIVVNLTSLFQSAPQDAILDSLISPPVTTVYVPWGTEVLSTVGDTLFDLWGGDEEIRGEHSRCYWDLRIGGQLRVVRR